MKTADDCSGQKEATSDCRRGVMRGTKITGLVQVKMGVNLTMFSRSHVYGDGRIPVFCVLLSKEEHL